MHIARYLLFAVLVAMAYSSKIDAPMDHASANELPCVCDDGQRQGVYWMFGCPNGWTFCGIISISYCCVDY